MIASMSTFSNTSFRLSGATMLLEFKFGMEYSDMAAQYRQTEEAKQKRSIHNTPQNSSNASHTRAPTAAALSGYSLIATLSVP